MLPSLHISPMVSVLLVLTIGSASAQINPFRSLPGSTVTPASAARPSTSTQKQELNLADYLRGFRFIGFLETDSGQMFALIRQGSRQLQIQDGTRLGSQPVILTIRRTPQGPRAFARYQQQVLELTP